MGELLLLYFTELVFSDNDGDGGGGGERENGFYLISTVICYLKKKKHFRSR